MAETAFLQLPRAGGSARWLLVDAIGNRIGGVQRGTLSEAAAQLHGRRLVALAPGEHVTLYRADIPSRNAQKVLQAAPYTLEDRLAEEVDGLHFAASERLPAGYLIAVAARTRMRDWQRMLNEAQLVPAQIIPDMTAIPPQEGELRVVLDDGFALVRYPDGSGFTAEADLAPALLHRHLLVKDAASALQRISLRGADEQARAALATALDGVAVEVAQEPTDDAALAILAAGLHGQRGLDLQQGEFKVHGSAEERWRTWRIPAVLLAACLLLGLTQEIIYYVHLKREAVSLDAQVAEVFSQAMPGSRSQPGSEQVRMQQRLTQLQGGASGTSLLPMLDALGGALAANPSVQVSLLDYRNGSLQAQLQAGNAVALDGIKTALGQQAGYSVKLDSVSVTGNQATGRLILQGASSP
jgi:general secretion pathway protein L